MYMSNHPDTLVAYAKWYGKVKEPIAGAKMSSITTKVGFQMLETSGCGLKRELDHMLDVRAQGWVDEGCGCAY